MVELAKYYIRFLVDGDEEKEVLSTTSYACPFAEGEELWLNVVNNGPDVWDIKPSYGKYVIEKIEKTVSVRYPPTGKINSIQRPIDVDITVRKYGGG